LPEAADQLTTADASPAAALTEVGADGTPAGTTAALGAEAGPVPTALVAVTVNVYAVPFVRPVTVHVNPTLVVHVRLPGLLTTV
jgi:hypothetical protein